MSFVKDLYSDYDIYNNYLTFLTKVSPVCCLKPELMYNYVLKDSAYIGKSGATTLCFIQEENELTFKGDFG
jgi:hypothetical protein